MSKLAGSVGQEGRNLTDDVHLVQTLFVQIGLDPGAVNGVCGEDTIATVRAFQGRFMAAPDGRIDPEGVTWKRLIDAAAPASVPVPAAVWSGDSSAWPPEKKLRSLEPVFRANIAQVIEALSSQAFQPKIVYGWRSVAVQQQLFNAHKSKVRFSFHNAQRPDGTPNALAVDVIDTRWGWTDEARTNGFWKALGKAGKDRGLVWGGDWVDFPDLAHLQGRQNSQLAAVKKESGL